ncbi:NAD-dependent aldehyde dehydrogenase [Massariosphaeria phaeospora]|uniref:NAD-dependent aldehyde dehydrogenase n=1 Tax=Massariosphaeria phaeospora TaxID=100035 RepID=A0A7C8HYM5_9PLEO|nr:NAD-dependent aldehyde dehydrogenase [Massariosphaeria phaeospora]
MTANTASEDFVVPLFINGKDITHPGTFDVASPSSNKICWTAISATPDDGIAAVDAAQNAFSAWSQSKPSTRTAVLLKAADILEANSEEYASYMMTEMGADRGTAQFFVLPLAISMCRDIAGRITSICGSVPVVAQEGQSAMVWKEPYGVCLGIIAWNAPYVFAIRSAATAIATGNTTVIKSSEMTPHCVYVLSKVFKEAGLPDGVLNILSCRREDAPSVVNAMIEHPFVRKVNFTGSVAVGRKIARVCGENLKPCLMELGGKNSAIVLEDADLQKTARQCIAGAFLNAGQICMGTDRIVAHSSIADELLEILKQKIAQAAKESEALPNVVSTASKARLVNLVSEAISKGAQLIAGSDSSTSTSGASFIPTVLANVNQETKLSQDETFGPLVAVSTFDTDDEAIQFANNTPYGLHAAVFTKDLRKGLAFAKRLQVGAVHINSMTVHDEPAMPMGGVKSSGWGRFNAAEGMDEFLVRKAVTWDD